MENDLELGCKAHLFICTHLRESDDECCGSKGAEDLRLEIKELAKKRWTNGEVKVSRSGCLGQCNRGISAVLYPQGKWLVEINSKDSSNLLKELEKSLN